MNLKLFIFTFCTFSTGFSQQVYRINLNDSSRLLINGQANITDYTCELNQTFSLKSLDVYAFKSPRSIRVDSANLKLLVKNFDCGISKMNRDFQESMKADSFPNMTLQLNQIYLRNETNEQVAHELSGNVKITIANVSNFYDIKFTHTLRADSFHVVKGKHQMFMTDFKIVPPTALFGLIRVYGNIEIEFELIFKIEEKIKPSR